MPPWGKKMHPGIDSLQRSRSLIHQSTTGVSDPSDGYHEKSLGSTVLNGRTYIALLKAVGTKHIQNISNIPQQVVQKKMMNTRGSNP